MAPASVVLFYIANELNALEVAVLAGAGGVIGDLIIFHYLKNTVFEELKPFYKNHGRKVVNKLIKTPYFSWLIPIVGAAIIASPLPDEIGLSILGFSKIKLPDFIVLTFLLNTLGIFFIIIAAKSF